MVVGVDMRAPEDNGAAWKKYERLADQERLHLLIRTFAVESRTGTIHCSLHCFIERQMSGIQRLAHARESSHSTHSVQVISQRDAMTFGDFEDLVLAVTIKGGPLDLGMVRVALAGAPVICHLLALMAHLELAALMFKRKTDY